MSDGFSRPQLLVKTIDGLISLRADERGAVAVIMAILLPILVGGLGLGFEISNWYLQKRAMQNAADAAAIAAATNGGSNYDLEAKAVAAQYGLVDGSKHVTVTASNTAPCPSGGNNCYSVTISRAMPLYLSQVVGYGGNIKVDGDNEQLLSSAAVAKITTVQAPLCLLALHTSGQAIRTDGSPKTDFSNCSIMSDSDAQCNGSNLLANYGLAHKTSNGCGYTPISDVPIVPDPYSYLADDNIPSQSILADASHCNGSYPQETKKGSHYSGGTAWSGSKTLTGIASMSGNTLICGDLRLTGDVTITGSPGVLFIDNGLLDLNGYTLRTASGSAVTIVFTGTNSGSYNHYPTDNGGTGVLNIQAPQSGPWSGVAIYQDPKLTTNVSFTYTGNNPTWDITGLVYLPNADLTFSGAVNKSTYGASCMVMVVGDTLVNGTGNIYKQSPAGCIEAGLNMPTAIIPGRGQLVD